MATITIRAEAEQILGRELTSKEVKFYRIFWAQIFMNPVDLAARIETGK